MDARGIPLFLIAAPWDFVDANHGSRTLQYRAQYRDYAATLGIGWFAGENTMQTWYHRKAAPGEWNYFDNSEHVAPDWYVNNSDVHPKTEWHTAVSQMIYTDMRLNLLGVTGQQPDPVNSFDLFIPDWYYDSPSGSVDRTIQCVLSNTGNLSGTVTLTNISRFPGNSNANVSVSGSWTLPDPGKTKTVNLVLSADTVPRTQSVVYFTASVNGYNVSKELTVYNATADGISPFTALPVGVGRTLAIPVRDRAWVCLAADADNGARVHNAGDSPIILNVAPYAPSAYAVPDFTTGETLAPGESKVFSNVGLGGDALLFAICTRKVYPPVPWKPGTNYSKIVVTRGE
jgi:hypothetical protein